jgi:hypothetical protein
LISERNPPELAPVHGELPFKRRLAVQTARGNGFANGNSQGRLAEVLAPPLCRGKAPQLRIRHVQDLNRLNLTVDRGGERWFSCSPRKVEARASFALEPEPTSAMDTTVSISMKLPAESVWVGKGVAFVVSVF